MAGVGFAKGFVVAEVVKGSAVVFSFAFSCCFVELFAVNEAIDYFIFFCEFLLVMVLSLW